MWKIDGRVWEGKGRLKGTHWEILTVKQVRNNGDLDQGSGIRDVLSGGF